MFLFYFIEVCFTVLDFCVVLLFFFVVPKYSLEWVARIDEAKACNNCYKWPPTLSIRLRTDTKWSSTSLCHDTYCT